MSKQDSLEKQIDKLYEGVFENKWSTRLLLILRSIALHLSSIETDLERAHEKLATHEDTIRDINQKQAVSGLAVAPNGGDDGGRKFWNESSLPPYPYSDGQILYSNAPASIKVREAQLAEYWNRPPLYTDVTRGNHDGIWQARDSDGHLYWYFKVAAIYYRVEHVRIRDKWKLFPSS